MISITQEFKEEQQRLHGECEAVMNEGRALAAASSSTHAEDIDKRLQRVQYHWRHLQQTVLMRTSKLMETLAAIKQLEHGMSQLRQWLASVERLLANPIKFAHATHQEVQRQHAEQQVSATAPTHNTVLTQSSNYLLNYYGYSINS